MLGMKKRLLVFILIASFGSAVVSQTTERLPCLDKKFSIVAHIVRDSLKNNPYILANIQQSVDSLNKQFSPICVSFEICEFRYIDNFQYLRVDTAKEWKEMQVLYHVKNRINIYYVNTLLAPSGAGFAGLGKIGEFNKDGLVLTNASDKLINHEMGHYFGLKHTFETEDGKELVDGSNCATTGDKICDTPADPNGAIDGSCTFTDMQKDANGDFYDPLVNNIMSYYPATCGCGYGFTNGQYKRMVETYLAKKGMW